MVRYDIGVDGPITPEHPLPDLPKIPPGDLVVIEGRAPIWRYAMALHRLHGSPAGAVATFDPRLGAVIVASHNCRWVEGEVIPPNKLEAMEHQRPKRCAGPSPG
jgi:CRISPR-associated protein Csx3